VKLAISSTGSELSNLLDPRFGRCRYYVIIDSDTMEHEAVANTGSRMQ
jgi:predicted Fe-Mo cluster-binding NifX family protein